jgi:exonuclease III
MKDNLNMNYNERGNVNLTNTYNKESSNKISPNEQQVKLSQLWSFGTINIRSGKEKEEGAKLYAIATEVNRAGLLFCCLQEVRYRNTGNKLIKLDTGEAFEFHWCGQKRRREAGVGILVRIHPEIEISNPDINNPRVMAINIKIHGFNLRVINGYAPTNCDGSENQKQTFYRLLKEACTKNQKHQKLIILGDFNATTSIAKYKSCYDGIKVIPTAGKNDTNIRQLYKNEDFTVFTVLQFLKI